MSSNDGGGGRRAHWDVVYGRTGDSEVSWYPAEPTYSLALIDALRLGPEASVVDIGGGASRLVDALMDRGFTDLRVLDLSSVALEHAQRRLGAAAGNLRWVAQDLLIALPAIFRGIGVDPLDPAEISYLLWMLLGFMVVTSVFLRWIE